MPPSPLNQKAVEALDRCAYLLRKISDGDHKALENARDASDEAAAVLREIWGDRPEWDDEDEEDDADAATAGHHELGGEG